MLFIIRYVKNNKQILSKTQIKASKRSTQKVSKSFWRKKKQNSKKGRRWYQNLSEEQKQKVFEYIINYYIKHKSR